MKPRLAVILLPGLFILAAARAEPPAPLPQVELKLSGTRKIELTDKPLPIPGPLDPISSSALVKRVEVLAAGHANAAPAEGNTPALVEIEGDLRWSNGETLSGGITGATSESLSLKAALFAEPLVLDWSALRRFDQTLSPRPTSDPFAFTLRDGGHLYGDLVSVTADMVAIHSARHGDARLKRSEVLSMRRLHGGGLLAGGPAGDVGWDVLSRWKSLARYRSAAFPADGLTGTQSSPPGGAKVPVMATGPGGALLLPYWNTGVFNELALPERVDLEFRVRATRRPEFLISLEADVSQSLRIETWDNEVVLIQGDRFFKLATLSDTERTVALRLCWDRATNRCGVYTPEGAPLADLDWTGSGLTPGKGSFQPALVLLNKGRDLALEFLRVRSWDGTPPRPLDSWSSSLALADGRMVPGEIAGASAGSVQLRVGGANAVAGFPLDQVDALIFSSDAPSPPSDPPMTLTWADGTFLTGAIENMVDGKTVVRTSFTDALLSARVEGLRQIRLRPPAMKDGPPGRPLEAMDKLAAGQTTLHGSVVCAGEDQPRWLPIGGLQAVPLAHGTTYEIDRALPPSQETQGAPALFYTSTGDILPGRLRALDRTSVDFDSDFVEAKKLLPADLNAIQFDSAPHTQIDGFSDPGWQVLKGTAQTVERKDGTLTMEPGTMIGHASALQCSEFKFSLDSNSYSSLRLRMFCAGTDPTHSVSLLLMQSGQTLYYGLESGDGQMESQQEANAGGGMISFQIAVSDRQIDVYVNGNRLQSFPAPGSRRAGNGLIIEPASMWGNPLQTIHLSGFSARFVPGHVSLPDVNTEAKSQALTVPRFRKDDPPRQVLIAANGDVLRGELEAATAKDFAFRSGLESLTVPRNRVKAAIWLKKPVEGEPPAAGTGSRQSRLDRKSPFRGRYGGMTLQNLVGIFTQADPDLKFKFPKREIRQSVQMRFDEPTVGEALDQICTAFGLHYRLEGKDTVVFEEADTAPANMTRATYWLTPGAFLGPGTAQDILTAKGVTFPEDASVQWEAGSRQLVMTNTPENQRKLADVLRTGFGGSPGAPTHWLVLANGARLGLAVERFETDRIVGHHPLYGRCDVPLSAVYAIRTSSPEESPAMKGFEDWRLVYSPEPVLPEAGGDSSALVGKEAKTFKLPLLDGGEFDLAQEKGKVVVLDFWATWCGPCVQSLPGLIEAMSVFPADKVRFIGLDQDEPAPQVKRFLETRGWKLTVAMDAAKNVGLPYGADAIPLMVIIAPDGKVAWVRNGYQPGGEEEIADTVKKLLAGLPAS